MECGSPILKNKSKQIADETITIQSEATYLLPTTKEEAPPTGSLKVNFAIETTSSRRGDSCELVESQEKPVEQEVHSTAEPEEPLKVVSDEIDPPKKIRPIRKGKKEDEIVDEKVVEVQEKRQSSEKESKQESTSEDDASKKKTRKIRKPVEEKQTTTTSISSPRVTRHQKNQEPPVRTQNSPQKLSTKRNILEQRNQQFNSPSSSPVRKVFTPKLVFR